MKGFGLELVPINEELLETVRLWRNDAAVAQFMEFKEEISVSDQQKWFNSIQNAYYFVIKSAETTIGLIDLKKIDTYTKSAESGLFIGNKSFLQSGIALGASVLLLDFAFGELKLNTVTAKINQDNNEAVKYNQFLGFKRMETIRGDFHYWELKKEQYFINREKLVKLLA